jgi:hypothetical protein
VAGNQKALVVAIRFGETGTSTKYGLGAGRLSLRVNGYGAVHGTSAVAACATVGYHFTRALFALAALGGDTQFHLNIIKAHAHACVAGNLVF